MKTHLLWFRRDLRVQDNPALFHACEKDAAVIGVFIASGQTWARHAMSACQQQWLRRNLDALKKSLHALHIPLLILQNDYYSESAETLARLAHAHKACALFYNAEYPYDERRRDEKVQQLLEKNGVKVWSYADQNLIPPKSLLNAQGKPYTVFTPYKNSAVKLMLEGKQPRASYPAPEKRRPVLSIDQKDTFTPPETSQDTSWLEAGEKAAAQRLDDFVENRLDAYAVARDFPAKNGTSQISAYLALGVLSARQCFDRLLAHTKNFTRNEALEKTGSATWLSELLWRDFYKMICFHFPHVSRGQAFKRSTQALRWSKNTEYFDAWANGQTGVPIIDSAMRQLNATGWMHNRLRMIVAMYFSKNLWLDWREGEAYFASRLVDWDFSANNGGWQWCASTGNDAAPYFRVFNPILQSERFDAEGDFIRHYLPELAHLKSKAIHDPHARHTGRLDYPAALVNLKETRKAAIAAFKALK